MLSSLDIAKSLNMKHRSIYLIISKHFDLFKMFGTIDKKVYKQEGPEGGRPCDYFLLNEKHKLFLIMLLKNSNEGVRIKANTLNLIFEKEGEKGVKS